MSSKKEKPKEDDDSIIRRMAGLSPTDYDRVRKNTSDEMGIQLKTLDALVNQARTDIAKAEAADDVVEEIEPWDQPVNGAVLLDDMATILDRHVILPNGGHIAIPLWALGSYCMDAWRVWAKLLITSPVKRCGKTVLLEAMEGVVYRALLTSNITPSAIFRCIEEWTPTLMMDEADTFAKDNDELNGIINAGHTRRTAAVIRTEKIGDGFRPVKFSVWSPQVIAGIGEQRGTLHDRSIHIEMRRKMPGEQPVKLAADYYEQQINIRRRCLRWAEDNVSRLKASQIQAPDCGNDRAQDNWSPLFAMAEIVGDAWLEKVNSAYLIFNESEDDERDNAGVMLLRDIQEIFNSRVSEKIFSEDLVFALTAIEDRPWQEWRRGKPLTQNSLSRLLKPYHIKPGTVRIGGATQKGYYRSKFEDAFSRYLSITPIQSVTPSQVNSHAGFSDFQSVTPEDDVTVSKSRKRRQGAGCDGVTVENGTLETEEKNQAEVRVI